MEFFLIVIGIVTLIVAYFCAGISIKFLWGWWPLILGISLGAVSVIFGGWTGALIGIILILGSIGGTNSWQNTDVYVRFENRIERAFYFRD